MLLALFFLGVFQPHTGFPTASVGLTMTPTLLSTWSALPLLGVCLLLVAISVNWFNPLYFIVFPARPFSLRLILFIFFVGYMLFDKTYFSSLRDLTNLSSYAVDFRTPFGIPRNSFLAIISSVVVVDTLHPMARVGTPRWKP